MCHTYKYTLNPNPSNPLLQKHENIVPPVMRFLLALAQNMDNNNNNINNMQSHRLYNTTTVMCESAQVCIPSYTAKQVNYIPTRLNQIILIILLLAQHLQ